MKAISKVFKVLLVILLCGLASAANVNTLSDSASGSSLILLLKNATDTTYYYAELNKTVSDLRTMADLQSDTPEGYSVYTGEVGPLNEGNIESLDGYTNANLAAYLAGNSSDNITWTIMGSKSAPQATAGAAAFAITSNQDFVGTWFWENQATWTAANFFGTAFITDELNNGAWTNGQSSANGWGSATPNGVGAPVSFNGDGFENGAALGQSQSVYLLATTGGDVANVYKSTGTLTLSIDGTLTYDPGSSPTTYAVTATVSGNTGEVILQNNGSDDQTVASGGGSATFAAQTDGSGYNVTTSSPTGQTCNVLNGSGTISGADVTNVIVDCTTNTYTVGGTVSGLTGTVVLTNNGGDDQSVSANAAFTFTTQVAYNGAYAVEVKTQPVGQTCLVLNGSDTVTSNVTNVSVTCVTNAYTVGGTVSGLTGTVVLTNSGGDDRTVSANGAFSFATKVAYNGAYAVAVKTQPVGQMCLVLNGSGTVTSNVSDVTVTCTTSTYTISANLNGLRSGNSIVLVYRIGSGSMDSAVRNSNSSWVLASNVNSSVAYSVKVGIQPAGQYCTVSGNASGLVTAENLTINIDCLDTYTVGGLISGLSVSGLVVSLNNTSSVVVQKNAGSFLFASGLRSGSAYSVTIKNQPLGRTCLVSNGSGVISVSSVRSVIISCQ